MKMRLIPYIRKTETPSRIWPETSRFFEEFFNDFPFAGLMSRDNWMPAVDVLEKEGKLILRAELPGMNDKEIELKLENRTLTLKGERKRESEDRKDNYHRVECSYGSFSRSFELPDSADCDKIKAEYKNGILTVEIPQKPEVRPREIPVSVH